MRMWRAVLLGLLGLAAGSPVPARMPAAHTLIARCAQRAGTTLRGLDALRSACPGIEQAVHDLGLDALLPADWSRQASAVALADLADLADRYTGPAPALRLSAARLRAVALRLKPPPSPPSLWERFEAWIRARLGSASAGSTGWLRFLPHVSVGPRLRRLLFELLAGLVVIAAGALVVVELRASGLVGAGRRPRPTERRSSAGNGPTEERAADLADLDHAAPRERPVMLLRWLVQALARSHRLERDRDLTCRELIAHARFDTARQREDFGRVALLAESALYGGPQAAAAAIPEEVLSGARALHAQLLAAPATSAVRAAAAARSVP